MSRHALPDSAVRLFAEGTERHTIAGMWALSAMSIDMPDVPGHPNRVPFKGIVTRLDEPSDNPVGGAKGKRILIPRAVAEEALPSFLGMGVNYVPGLTGHDPTRKIGVITEAWIDGDALWIKGDLYGSDFPDVVAEIKAKKDMLGFSYEATAAVESWKADPAVVTACYFTGAAILYKDRAAYTTTTLEAAAQANEDVLTMELTQEQLDALIAERISAATAGLTNEVATLKASNEKLSAAAELHARVKPHADNLRAAAEGLKASGFGLEPKDGHVAVLHRVADKMEAEAMIGKPPHTLTDCGWLNASADNGEHATQLAAAADEVASLKAELADTKQKLFAKSESPVRETLTASTTTKPAADAAHGDAGNGVEPLADMRLRLKAEGKSGREIAVALTAHADKHNLPPV